MYKIPRGEIGSRTFRADERFGNAVHKPTKDVVRGSQTARAVRWEGNIPSGKNLHELALEAFHRTVHGVSVPGNGITAST